MGYEANANVTNQDYCVAALHSPTTLSESMLYSSANFLFTVSAFETSYTWIVATCNLAGAFRFLDDFYAYKAENEVEMKPVAPS